MSTIKNKSVINPEDVKKLKYRREKIKAIMNSIENDELVVANLLLNELRAFVKDNPSLYDNYFEVKKPHENIRVSFSKNRQAYRVQFLAWFGDSLETVVYLIPQLLLDDKEAYKAYRERYLRDLEMKESVKLDQALAVRSANDLLALYGSHEALIENGFQGAVEILNNVKPGASNA